MPQLHLYVPEEVASAVRRKADQEGLSVSRYLAHLVRREIGRGWPEGYFEEVVGGWHGEALERPPQGTLETRDVLDES